MMHEMDRPVRVLLVEDDVAIRHLLRSYFQQTPYRVIEATTGRDALSLIAEKRPDVVLLDLGLPDMEGADVIADVRHWSAVPIIVISARGQEEQKVRSLELGADDYLTKPFGLAELTARMQAAMRRAAQGSAEAPVFEGGGLKIDFATRRVWVREEPVHLTPLEYRLLTLLAQHAGKVVTHKQLLAEVWGSEYSGEAQYLRVYMGYLRRKLEEDPADPKLILTEHRVGYRLSA